MKLQTKVVLLFCCASLIIVSTTGGILYTKLKQEKLESIGEELGKQLELLDLTLVRFLEDVENDIRNLAADSRVRAVDDSDFTNFLEADEQTFEYAISEREAEIIEILNNYRLNHPSVNSVYMGRENGSFVRSHKRSRPTKYDPRTRPWYMLARDNPWKIMITPPYRSVTTDDVNVGVVTALIDQQSQVYGVIGADVTLTNLTTYIADFHVGYSGEIIMINQGGLILSSHQPEMRFKKVSEVFSSSAEKMMKASQGLITIDTPNGPQYACVLESPRLHCVLVAMIPTVVLKKAVQDAVLNNIVITIVGLTLLSLTLLAGLDLFIIQPISRLTESSQLIEKTGNLEHRVDVKSEDEIGSLAAAMNKMIETIALTEKRLMASQSELQRHKDQLEDRVRERTLELESVNAELHKEIDERQQAEAKVKESSRRLAQIVSFLPDATYVIDNKGRVTAWNHAMEEMTGIESESMIGLGGFEYALPFYGERRPCLIDMALEWDEQYAQTYENLRWEGDTLLAEALFPSLRGEKRFIWSAARKLYDQSDNVMGAIHSLRDITEWKEASDELKRSEIRYRSLFENAMEAILVAQNRYWKFANPQGEVLFGYDQEELTSRPIDEFIHPDDRQLVMERHTRRLAGESPPDQYSFRLVDREGRTKWTEIKAVAITWDDQPAVLCFLTDISKRVRAEKELQIQTAYLEELFNASPEAIAMVSERDRVQRINKSFTNLFGYEPEEMVGQSLDEAIVPTRLREEGKTITALIMKGESLFKETVRQKKNGELVDVSVTGASIRVGGQDAGVFGIYRDISEQKRAERDLKEAKEAAESASRAKGMFLANMSHEIRTPLNAILGYTQLLLRDSELRPIHRTPLETVRRSGEHLLGLLNDILEMSKIEAGRATLKQGDFNLLALIDDLISMFRVLTDEKGLSLGIEVSKEVPQWIYSDEQKLRQILNNLIGNAVKFTSEGRVDIRARTVIRKGDQVLFEPESRQLRIEFEVEDTGPGIPDSDRDRIFGHFEQLRIGSETKGGSGLGLAICKAYIELMDGSIEVTRRKGKGSLFRFNILVKEGDEKTAAWKESDKRRVIGLQPGQEGIRVLVVDDNAANRQILVGLMEVIGFTVREATDGLEAIVAAQEWQPDIILMDIFMPNLDGFEAISQLRAAPYEMTIPIIAVTASVLEEEHERILAIGADAFLKKPFREEEVLDLMKTLLDLEFVYADGLEAAKSSLGVEETERIESVIKGLPDGLAADIRKAAVRLDIDRLEELFGQVALVDEPTAAILGNLMQNYDFDGLMKLFGDEAF